MFKLDELLMSLRRVKVLAVHVWQQLAPVTGTSFAFWGPFLETPDNFPGPKTILGVQYSPVAIQFLLILKAKF